MGIEPQQNVIGFFFLKNRAELHLGCTPNDLQMFNKSLKTYCKGIKLGPETALPSLSEKIAV